MLTDQFVYLAIEPVTTTAAIIAAAKLLGAGAVGGTVGNAAGQTVKNKGKKKKKKVKLGKALSEGVKTPFEVASFVSSVASYTDSPNQDDYRS